MKKSDGQCRTYPKGAATRVGYREGGIVRPVERAGTAKPATIKKQT